MPRFIAAVAFCCVVLPFVLRGQTTTNVWFFRDATNPGFYDSGLAFKTSPSDIEQAGSTSDKIPTDATTVFQGNNSLKLRWTSRTSGDWSALVIAPGFPYQDISQTDTLAFWAFAPNGLAKAAMPTIFMEVAPGSSKTRKVQLSNYANDLPTAAWFEIKLPLSIFFNDAANASLNFSLTKAIIFGQAAADATEHTLYIDNVRTFRGTATAIATPTNLAAQGYDSHVELTWTATAAADAYQIWRSTDGGATFGLVKTTVDNAPIFEDFVRPLGLNLTLKYKIKAIGAGSESAFSNETAATTRPFSDDELLTMVQQYTFRYFRDFAQPTSGMARERNTSGNVVTTGGTGFGIMAWVVAVERGFAPRTEGVAQMLQICTFLENADRFHGAFPHWLDGQTGRVVPFSTYDNGGDLVETSFLMQGLLTAKQYFNGSNADETLLRSKITALWQAVEWSWYRRGGSNVLYWHWSPNYDWRINFPLIGYFEALITYVLAVASPTNGVPASLYSTGWTASPNYVNGQTYYGNKLYVGPLAGGPLFFAHYSFLGFDPRGRRDAFANYFVHNRNQSLINQAYCASNPRQFVGYSAETWGLTASDDPNGYSEHAPLASNDNGTITPTAALGSMPYTPTLSLAALKNFYRNLGARLWGKFGFYDAFNPTRNWYADSYLAIDQGPIVGMIENHRTGLLWRLFMQNPEIKPALDAMGFVPDATDVSQALNTEGVAFSIFPNPTAGKTTLEFEVKTSDAMSLDVADVNGRVVRSVFSNRQFPFGKNQIEVSSDGLAAGFYVLILRGSHFSSRVAWAIF